MHICVFLTNTGPERELMKSLARSLRSFGNTVLMRNPEFVVNTEYEHFDGAVALDSVPNLEDLTTLRATRLSLDGQAIEKYERPNFAGEEGLILVSLQGNALALGDVVFDAEDIELGEMARFMLYERKPKPDAIDERALQPEQHPTESASETQAPPVEASPVAEQPEATHAERTQRRRK